VERQDGGSEADEESEVSTRPQVTIRPALSLDIVCLCLVMLARHWPEAESERTPGSPLCVNSLTILSDAKVRLHCPRILKADQSTSS